MLVASRLCLAKCVMGEPARQATAPVSAESPASAGNAEQDAAKEEGADASDCRPSRWFRQRLKRSRHRRVTTRRRKPRHPRFLQQAVKWLKSADEVHKKAAQLRARIGGVPDKLAELEAKLA